HPPPPPTPPPPARAPRPVPSESERCPRAACDRGGTGSRRLAREPGPTPTPGPPVARNRGRCGRSTHRERDRPGRRGGWLPVGTPPAMVEPPVADAGREERIAQREGIEEVLLEPDEGAVGARWVHRILGPRVRLH